MFKAVMFDLDGTTVDTLDDLKDAMNAMLSHFGYPERSREEIRSFLGYGQKEFVTRSLPECARNGENIEKCNRYYDDFYAENNVHKSLPFDGIPEILAALKARGIYTVLFTNKNQGHAVRIVESLFDSSLFDMIVGAPTYKRKPDPEGVFAIAKALGVEICDCAFVGDSEVDILTAKNSGTYGIGVTWGFREKEVLTDAGADATADNAAELSKILGL